MTVKTALRTSTQLLGLSPLGRVFGASGSQLPRQRLHSHLPLVDGDPVGGGEPLVALDIVDSVPEVPEALGEVHLQQVSQQVLQVRAEVGREAHLAGVGRGR